jgi:hypothetical protein
MIRLQGRGPRAALIKSGPPTLPPGNTFTISAPHSSAAAISLTLPQPGI